MRARAEGLTGVYDHVQRFRLRGLTPGWADHHAAVRQDRGLVEVAPAVGPVVGNSLGRDLDEVFSRRRLDLAQVG
jgi:hypothetical protein